MSISEHSNISLYGKGVFTTVAVCKGEPFSWEKHWQRLVRHSERIGLEISEHSSGSVRRVVSKEIERSGIVDGRVRVSFLDASSSEIWGGNETGTLLSVLVGERRDLANEFKLGISEDLVCTASPLAGIKSCNYLEPLLTLGEAKNRGFDEAIRLNERGEITSACMANVFWHKAGRLYTPSLKTGCLAGTTREYILENLECDEVEAGIEELNRADEIFLTSAGIGVVQVAEFDRRKLAPADRQILRVLPF